MSGFNPWCARIPRPKKKSFAPRGSSFLVGGLSLGCLSPVKRSAMSFSRSGRYAGLTTTWCLRIGSLRESCRYSRNRGKASSSMIAWPLSSAIFVVPEGQPIFRADFLQLPLLFRDGLSDVTYLFHKKSETPWSCCPSSCFRHASAAVGRCLRMPRGP